MTNEWRGRIAAARQRKTDGMGFTSNDVDMANTFYTCACGAILMDAGLLDNPKGLSQAEWLEKVVEDQYDQTSIDAAREYGLYDLGMAFYSHVLMDKPVAALKILNEMEKHIEEFLNQTSQ